MKTHKWNGTIYCNFLKTLSILVKWLCIQYYIMCVLLSKYIGFQN